jgi:hypothetical protein
VKRTICCSDALRLWGTALKFGCFFALFSVLISSGADQPHGRQFAADPILSQVDLLVQLNLG